jgi:hypothetical protein
MYVLNNIIYVHIHICTYDICTYDICTYDICTYDICTYEQTEVNFSKKIGWSKSHHAYVRAAYLPNSCISKTAGLQLHLGTKQWHM